MYPFDLQESDEGANTQTKKLPQPSENSKILLSS